MDSRPLEQRAAFSGRLMSLPPCPLPSLRSRAIVVPMDLLDESLKKWLRVKKEVRIKGRAQVRDKESG